MPKLIEPKMYVILTIIQEASSESLNGMIGVAEVIRNRAEEKYNSNGSLIDTVLRPYQFSGWNTKDPNRLRAAEYEINDPIVLRASAAYRIAFEDRSSIVMGANLYHADYMNPYPEWVNSPKVIRLTQIDRHIFYKEERE